MRHVLQRLWIGTWLASAAGGINLRGGSTDTKDHAKISAKDAALVYHKLHQLSLTGRCYYSRSKISVLALSAG